MSLSPFHALGTSALRTAALTLAACVGLGAATTGCFVVDDGGTAPNPPSDTPAQESLDTDGTLSVTPGNGAGLFVQYATGGAWDVFTSCDTAITDRPCGFDIIISADSAVSFSDPKGQELETADTLSLDPDGTIHLTTSTGLGLNGVTFMADAGATIRVDMLLDGSAQPSYVNWISGGLHQQGTTTNPVDFIPTAP